MAYKFQLGAAKLSGSITAEEGLNAGNAGVGAAGAVAGATTIVTTGDVTVGGHLVADGDENKNIFAAVTTTSNNITIGGGAKVVANGILSGSGAIQGQSVSVDGVVTAGGFTIGSAVINEAELEQIDGITAGTVAASKAVVVDSNKDADGFRNVSGSGTLEMDIGTFSGVVTAGGFTIGSAVINEAELETIDGITAGTATASKAVILDSDKRVAGVNRVTVENGGSVRIIDGSDNNVVQLDQDGSNRGRLRLFNGTTLQASLANGTVSGSGNATFEGNIQCVNGTLTAGAIALGDASGIAGTGIDNNAGSLQPAAAQTLITSIINSGFTKLGTATNQENIDFGTANNIIMNVNNSAALTVNDDGVYVHGNFFVSGSTITVDSTSINVSSSFTFEGPASAHETTLHAGGDGNGDAPQADTNIYLPAMSSGNYFLPVLAVKSAVAISSTPAELNILDAVTRGSIIYGNASGETAKLAKGAADTVLTSDGTDISYAGVSNNMLLGSIADSKLNTITTAGKVALSALEIDGGGATSTLAGADLFIVDDGANGTNRKITATAMKSFFQGNSVRAGADASVGASATFTSTDDVILCDPSGSTQQVITMPTFTSSDVGRTITVKSISTKPSGSASIKITAVGGNKMETGTGLVNNGSIVLESAFAAVDLLICSGSVEGIFLAVH